MFWLRQIASPSAVLGYQRANKLSANKNTVDATDAFLANANRYALAA